MPGGSLLVPVAAVAEIAPVRDHRPLAGGPAPLPGGARILGTQPWHGHPVPVCWLSEALEGAGATGAARAGGAASEAGGWQATTRLEQHDPGGGAEERAGAGRQRLAVLHGVVDRRRMPFYGVVILDRPMMLQVARQDLRPLSGSPPQAPPHGEGTLAAPDAAGPGARSLSLPFPPPGPACPGVDVRIGERIARIPDTDALEQGLIEALFQS